MKKLRQNFLLLLSLSFFISFSVEMNAQKGKKNKKKKGDVAQDTANKPKKKAPKKGEPKAYKDLITDKAQTMEGFFSVHKIDDKYYFEIPDSIFGRDIMSTTRMSKTPTGAGYGGQQANQQVFRFEKGPDKNIFIRTISYVNVSPDSLNPITQAVENSNLSPIAAAFKIAAIRKDTSVVISVKDFFNKPNQAFKLQPLTQQFYKLRNILKDRSYIKHIKAFPLNVEVKTVKTYAVNPPRLTDFGRPQRSVNLRGGLDAGVVTFEMNTSMVLLPKVPMRRRFYDSRVGIFPRTYTVFDGEGQRAEREAFTVRWKLEPKNAADEALQRSGQAIEPKKPIVFYIDPATPPKWVQALKNGVEDWKPAFEQAGWKNAIQAKDWPENDSTMSLDDARYSVIRYFASDIQNAYGPNVHDPRSGEIIESHIGWFHNVMKLLKNWYTIQAGAVDPNSRPNQFDDKLMSELVRFVAAHEVGHTIGLMHNFGASFATPVEKLRDKAWLEANGHTSSIMDYARFNYVAQPEDGITDLFPRVGDYDKWAIEWNYKPIYDTKDAYEDKKVLNNWYKEKAANNNRLHYITQINVFDPRAQNEDLGNNSMLASEYGIKNLKRILPKAIEWTASEAEKYERAEEVYNNAVNQYRRYVGHVSKWVGGIYESPKTSDQDGVVFEPAPKDMQKSAVAFLNKQLFQTPTWILNKDILGKIRPDQGVAAISNIQKRTLNNLLEVNRLQRLIETEAGFPGAYGIDNLYSDLYNGIWSELRGGRKIDTHRRNLQKIHLENMIALLEPKPARIGWGFWMEAKVTPTMDPKMSDIVSVNRAYLNKLRGRIKAYIGRQSGLSRYHLEDCLFRINKALKVD